MADIYNLGPSISDMTDAEAFALVRSLRQIRRDNPMKVKKKAIPKKKEEGTKRVVKKKKTSPEDMIASMSDEQRANLLKQIEERSK